MAARTKTTKVDLTQEQIVGATLNTPELSEQSIWLNGRTYKIIDLEYDNYMKFTLFLKPLFNEILSKARQAQEGGKTDVTFSVADINLDKIFALFETTLPQMALVVLSATEPTMTLEECKHICKTPFKMLEVVLMQVAKNNIIEDFTSFFPQLARLM